MRLSGTCSEICFVRDLRLSNLNLLGFLALDVRTAAAQCSSIYGKAAWCRHLHDVQGNKSYNAARCGVSKIHVGLNYFMDRCSLSWRSVSDISTWRPCVDSLVQGTL